MILIRMNLVAFIRDVGGFGGPNVAQGFSSWVFK